MHDHLKKKREKNETGKGKCRMSPARVPPGGKQKNSPSYFNKKKKKYHMIERKRRNWISATGLTKKKKAD